MQRSQCRRFFGKNTRKKIILTSAFRTRIFRKKESTTHHVQDAMTDRAERSKLVCQYCWAHGTHGACPRMDSSMPADNLRGKHSSCRKCLRIRYSAIIVCSATVKIFEPGCLCALAWLRYITGWTIEREIVKVYWAEKNTCKRCRSWHMFSAFQG